MSEEERTYVEKEEELKSCESCKHLVGNREHIDSADNWKCGKTKFGYYTVTGAPLYFYCFLIRTDKDKCGLLGKWWEEYIEPARPFPAVKKSDLSDTL